MGKEYRLMPPEYKGGGVVRFMAEAERYVMVRRPGRMPFIVPLVDWSGWPECDKQGRIRWLAP